MNGPNPQSGAARPAPEVTPAVRMRRPKLTDPKLIIGTLLVVGSVALGSWVVQDAQASEPVYVASVTLTPGTVLGPENLRVTQARLLEHAAHYLVPTDQELATLVVTQSIAAGEFVPLSVLSPSDALEHRVIAIPLAIAPPEQVQVGAKVDLWHTDKDEQQPPTLVAGNLIVSEVPTKESMFTVSAAGQVHVVVSQDVVPAVLAAVQRAGSLALLPSPGGMP